MFANQFQALVTDTVFTINQLVETIELNQESVELKLFPNPTSHDIHVTLSQSLNGVYEVVDLNGKQLVSGEITSSFTIPSQSFDAGVYFLKIENHLFKFIKN